MPDSIDASSAARCAGCGASLPDGARFCPACGRPTAGDTAHSPAGAALEDGERRQLTVMFCDLVGSTQLGQRLDPEDLTELLGTYQRICGRQIERYDGHVAQYQGDGIVVYFGFPRAHEDDAERAIRAGLEIQNALAEHARGHARADGVRLEARVGIHTGPVVVGTMASGSRRESFAVGDTTNIAARIQSHAEAGWVVVSPATLRLVPGLFVTESLGPVALKGATETMELHRVAQQTGVRGRGHDRSPTPLVGRDAELALLLDRWQRARAGSGQIVVLSGEAGVGKSRLLRSFREQLAPTPHTWLDAECSPFAAATAFQPITELFARGLGFDQIAEADDRLRTLERLQLPDLEPEAVVPYVAALLQLPASPRYPLPQLSAELQRERTLQALVAIYQGLTRVQPVVLCLEDLHWSDPSTREFLARVGDAAPGGRGLLLITGRPEAWRHWRLDREHASHVELGRLTADDARRLVGAALRGSELPDEVVDKVVARADGVPLFLEELTKSVLESRDLGQPARGDDAAVVPATLQDSLTARLDRLSSAKVVAQIASTIGRAFSLELMDAVAGLDDLVLRAALAQLVDAEILYASGEAPLVTYVFKHALLQDTAYQSQLRTQRRERHARIADVIETRFPALAAAEPATLAHHCAEGGLTERAARHYERAGRAAVERLANAEAVDSLRRGLALIDSLPPSDDRDQLEIGVLVALGGPLAAMRGFDAAEVVEHYARLRAVTDRVGEGPQQLAAWIGLLNYYSQCDEFARLAEVGAAIARIAERMEIPVLFALGRLLVGVTRSTMGTASELAEALAPALALAEQEALPPPTSTYEPDMTAWTYAMAAFSFLYSAGDPNVALSYIQRATERAAALDHASTIANVKVLSCGVLFQLADQERIARFAGEAVELATDRGFRNLSTQAGVYLAWSRVAAGDPSAAAASVAAVDAYLASGSRSTVGWLRIIAADALRRAGRDDEALAQVDIADVLIERGGEIGYREWTCWLRGTIAERRGDVAAAARLFGEGLEIAQRQGHAYSALRHAIALAPLWARDGRAADARALLESSLRRFAPPSDTTTLSHQARTLLDGELLRTS